MEIVPRHEFVPWQLQREAYQDSPVPIGEGQTISQPYIVAHMLEALRLSPEDRVLEVGTGTGYEAAVMSRIVQEVYTIERFAESRRSGKEDLRSARIHEHSRGDRRWKSGLRGRSTVRCNYCGRSGSARSGCAGGATQRWWKSDSSGRRGRSAAVEADQQERWSHPEKDARRVPLCATGGRRGLRRAVAHGLALAIG